MRHLSKKQLENRFREWAMRIPDRYWRWFLAFLFLIYALFWLKIGYDALRNKSEPLPDIERISTKVIPVPEKGYF